MNSKQRAAIFILFLSTGLPCAGEAMAQSFPQFDPAIKGPTFSHRRPAFAAGAWPVDLNNDGINEIVLPFNNYPPGPNRGEQVAILQRSQNSPAFAIANRKFVKGKAPTFVHSRVFADGDFNGDGRRDLFIGGHGYDTAPFPGEKDKLLLSNREKTLDTVVAAPAQDSFTHAAASGDINRDGVDDIYVGVLCCGADSRSYFLMGRTGSAPNANYDLLPGVVSDWRQQTHTSAILTDVDNKNGVDLVLGSDVTSAGAVYLNNGAGSYFKEAPDFVLPPGLFGSTSTITVDIRSIDVNTDGLVDLVLSQTGNDPSYGGFGLQLLINTGNGFVDETSRRLLSGSGFNKAGRWAERIFLADFYGDGIKDIVISGAGLNNEANLIWLNDGKGVFIPVKKTIFEKSDPGDDQNAVFPLDLNRDGISDIVEINGVGQDSVQNYFQASSYINKGSKVTSSKRPIIARQPQQVSVKVGEPINLSISVAGQRPLRFEWYKNGKRISGEKNPIFQKSSASKGDSGSYRVKVISGRAFTESVSVQVIVNNE